jgi:hypothetical protein
MNIQTVQDINIPHQSYPSIFLRFLKFGFLAWGGPFAQIAMIRQELVEEEKWISPEKFNRVLSVYQALPGPEAHELCVYFGMIAGGRVGALLAGLGFFNRPLQAYSPRWPRSSSVQCIGSAATPYTRIDGFGGLPSLRDSLNCSGSIFFLRFSLRVWSLRLLSENRSF